MTVEVHAVLVQLGWLVDLCSHVGDIVCLAESFDELVFAQAVQILNNAVVVDDVQLVVWEDNCHEEVVFLFASVVWVVLFLLLSDQCCCSAAVVTVGDVHCRDFLVEEFN